MPCGAAAFAAGGERLDRRSLARTLRTSVEGVTLRVSVESDVFSLHENLWPGVPPDPRTTSARPKEAAPTCVSAF